MRYALLTVLLLALPAIGHGTPLTDAVSASNLATVKELLAQGADPNAAEAYHDTPLQIAAQGSNVPIVRALLDAGADPVLHRSYDTAPLGVAAYCGSTAPLLVMLDKVPSPDAPTDYTEGTALHQAALGGEAGALQVLLARKADPNARDTSGRTPLMLAARCFSTNQPRYAYEHVVSQLLAAGAEVNVQANDGRTALFQAAAGGTREVLGLLLEAGADPNLADAAQSTALMAAAERDDAERLRMLLDHGAGIGVRDGDGCTAALRAAKASQPGALALLLEAGDETSYPGNPKLDLGIAAALGDDARARTCLAGGAAADDPDHQGYTPLMRAITHGHPAVAIRLLDAGATLDTHAGEDWIGPLEAAARQGSGPIVSAIVDRLPKDDERQGQLDGALLAAAEGGHLEAAKVLLEAGASARASDSFHTALSEAVAAGALPLVELLIQHQADVDELAEYAYEPPLALAAEAGFAEITRLLLDNGASTEPMQVEWAYLRGGPKPAVIPALGPILAARHLAKARATIEAATDADALSAALDDLHAATLVLPTDPHTFYNLGVLAAELKQTDTARTAFQRALELQPDEALATDLRNRLAALPAQ